MRFKSARGKGIDRRLLEAGKFQLYFGGYGGIPSGYAQLMQLYGKEPPAVNASLFRSADYDRAMEEYLRSAGDAEQIATARRMSEIARTFVPIIPAIFRLQNDFVQPWVQGYRPQTFQTYWKYIDIDLARRRRKVTAAARSKWTYRRGRRTKSHCPRAFPRSVYASQPVDGVQRSPGENARMLVGASPFGCRSWRISDGRASRTGRRLPTGTRVARTRRTTIGDVTE